MPRPDLDAWQHHNFDPFDLDRMWDEVERINAMSTDQPTPTTRRATTASEKRVILERLFTAWEVTPELRLGQLLVNGNVASGGQADIFYVEDFDLIERVEKWQQR